jgi:hypothetical protein
MLQSLFFCQKTEARKKNLAVEVRSKLHDGAKLPKSRTVDDSVAKMLPQIDVATRRTDGPVFNTVDDETAPWWSDAACFLEHSIFPFFYFRQASHPCNNRLASIVIFSVKYIYDFDKLVSWEKG